MGVVFILVVDRLKTSPHILTLGTLLIVIVTIKMMFCEEDVILRFKRTMFFCFFKTLDMHIKIKLFKSYCSSIYESELWSLEDDVLQDFCCSWRTAIRRLLTLELPRWGGYHPLCFPNAIFFPCKFFRNASVYLWTTHFHIFW